VLSEHGMKIGPGTYCKWLACPVRSHELEEAYLVNAIVNLYRRNKCVYGVRKMRHAARRAGLRVGRDQVGRLMRIAGVQGVRRGAHRTVTTARDDRAPRHPDLVKRGWSAPNRPDAVWVADFTYVWTASGFCYVSFITDVYSRRILGWRASMSKASDLVTAALAQALSVRRRASSEFTTCGLIHHSDAGSQYTALAFTQELVEAGIAGSIGTVGDGRLVTALIELATRFARWSRPSGLVAGRRYRDRLLVVCFLDVVSVVGGFLLFAGPKTRNRSPGGHVAVVARVLAPLVTAAAGTN
jgi:transposase InsO family protein